MTPGGPPNDDDGAGGEQPDDSGADGDVGGDAAARQPDPTAGPADPVDDLAREGAGLPPLTRDDREPVTPPRPVRVAFGVLSVAAAVLVVGFGVLVGSADAVAADLLEAYEAARRAGDVTAQQRALSPSDIESGVPGLLWMLAAGALMIAGLVVLFAYKAREGTRSARTALVVLVGIVLVFCVGMPAAFVNPVIVLAVVLGIGGLVPLYLPAVAGYFPKPPRHRRRWRDPS